MEDKLEKEAQLFKNKMIKEDGYSVPMQIADGFIAGAQWQLENMWVPAEEGSPNLGIPVFVLTKNGSIAVSKMYTPKDCYGKVLGDKEWKGSNSFRESIVAWMYKPEFKKGEQNGQ